MIAVAIDIGGTFTDLVGFDDKAGRFVDAKSLTTPHDLVQGIIDCLHKSGLAAGAVDELIHDRSPPTRWPAWLTGDALVTRRVEAAGVTDEAGLGVGRDAGPG